MKALSRRDFIKAASAGAAAAAVAAVPFSVASAKPAAQEVVDISFMGWGDPVEDLGVRSAIDVFQQEQSAVTVTWLHTTDADYNAKLLANVAAGTPPDTAFISQSNFNTLVHDGLTMDITDLVQADPLISAPGYFIEPQETERSTNREGRWHGIGSTWTALHLYYNIPLLEAAGIEPPDFADDKIWDWDTFVTNAKALTLDANGNHPGDEGFDVNNVTQWGFYMDTSWWMIFDAMARFNGGQLSSGGLLTLDTPEAMAGIQAVADLIYVHQVMPQAVFFNDLGMSATQMIDTGRLAIVADGSWALASMQEMTTPFGVGPVPQLSPDGRASGQGHLHAILAGSQKADAAWAWLSFLATPFYQTHFNKLGLWIPNQTGLLTEEGLDSWITEGVHPANYRAFVSDYIPAYMSPSIVPAGYPRTQPIFQPALDQVMLGAAQAADVFPAAIAEANAILQAEYIDA
jgi:multiple sugar transport system substrate-binding protein